MLRKVTYFIEQVSEHSFLLDVDKVKEKGYLIKKIKYTQQGLAIELHSSLEALTLLAKNLGLFNKKVENEDEIWLILDTPVPTEGTEEPELK